MAKVTIHTCDKCAREIAEEEPHYVLTIHRMPRDSRGEQSQFDVCAECAPLVVELLRTPIADDIDKEFEGGEGELAKGGSGAAVTDITKHRVD